MFRVLVEKSLKYFFSVFGRLCAESVANGNMPHADTYILLSPGLARSNTIYFCLPPVDLLWGQIHEPSSQRKLLFFVPSHRLQYSSRIFDELLSFWSWLIQPHLVSCFRIYKETRKPPLALNKAGRSQNLAIKITEVKALVVCLSKTHFFALILDCKKADKTEFSWWPDLVMTRKWWRTLWSCQRRLALRLWSVRWEHCAQGCHHMLPIWSWIRWWS